MARPKGKRGSVSTTTAKTGTSKSGFSPWPWALAIGSLAVIVVAVVVGTQPSSSGSSPNAQGNAQQNGDTSESNEMTFDVERRQEGDVTAIGDVDAPIVMVEYSDLRCPFCAVVARDTLPQIIDEYVDSGKLRIEWRDFPIFGDESFDAAVAGRAAGAQGKFWDFVNAIYDEAPARSHIELPRERLIEFAKQAGVADIERFVADLDSPEYRDQVTADAEEAHSIGVSSTPIFIIGDTPVVGAQPFEAFAEAIEAELAKAGE